MNISTKIRMFRKFCGLSQFEFSKLLKVSPSTIASWEVGRRVPTLKHIVKFLELSYCKREEAMDSILDYCIYKAIRENTQK